MRASEEWTNESLTVLTFDELSDGTEHVLAQCQEFLPYFNSSLIKSPFLSPNSGGFPDSHFPLWSGTGMEEGGDWKRKYSSEQTNEPPQANMTYLFHFLQSKHKAALDDMRDRQPTKFFSAVAHWLFWFSWKLLNKS